jgi:hypothetical protein
MKLLLGPVEFEWDKGNSEKNLNKHNVSDKEAEEVFDAETKFLFLDELHSLTEKRYMIWGVSKNGRNLTVFFTARGTKIRIISARDMSKKERSEYAKKVQKIAKV